MMSGLHIPSAGVDSVEVIPLPPEALRDRVHGAADVESFLQVGRQCAEDIEAALGQIGKSFSTFETVLDFGCGCGRVLRWFIEQHRQKRFFGTDIDRQAVAWCGRSIPNAAFGLNAGLPPLGFQSNSFDLIYAISVFSHLNEEYQFHWLNELRRITKPGGIVLISLHGSYYVDKLPRTILASIEKQGMFFMVSGGWKGVLPDWYQSAFHSEAYVRQRYARYFDVLAYIPGGINDVQDAVVLQRRANDDLVLDQEIVMYAGVRQLHSHILTLEHLLEIKNAHVSRLEQKIAQLESGRVMRLLRMIA